MFHCVFSRILSDKASLYEACMALAVSISEKSPIAVQSSKINMIYSRDHSVQEGLDYIVSLTLNASFLTTQLGLAFLHTFEFLSNAEYWLNTYNMYIVFFLKI